MSQPERTEALVARAEELDNGSEKCFDPVHPAGQDFWEQGTAAFRQDMRLEECPFEPGPERDDWLRGWMAAELIEFGRFEDDPR
jgi:hypothetical protein